MSKALDVVKTFYHAALKGNIEEMTRLLAPDVRWTEMAGSPYGGTYVGCDAVVLKVFKPRGAEWLNFVFTPERFHDTRKSVAVSGWYTAISVKTRRRLHCRSLHVWDVREDKVIAFEQFCDSLLMHRSMT